MKNLKIGLVTLGVFLALAAPVKAREGTVDLGSKNGEMGSCFAVSVYYEDRYRVLMTCRGLRSALDPVRNRYVVWVKKGENLKRLGEIVNGKMRASVDQDFEGMVITVEEDGYAKKPNETRLLSGKVEEIVFSDSKGSELSSALLQTAGSSEPLRVAPTPTPVVEKVESTGGVFKVLGKALLTGFGVLLVVVGVLSYLSRRRK